MFDRLIRQRAITIESFGFTVTIYDVWRFWYRSWLDLIYLLNQDDYCISRPCSVDHPRSQFCRSCPNHLTYSIEYIVKQWAAVIIWCSVIIIHRKYVSNRFTVNAGVEISFWSDTLVRTLGRSMFAYHTILKPSISNFVGQYDRMLQRKYDSSSTIQDLDTDFQSHAQIPNCVRNS